MPYTNQQLTLDQNCDVDGIWVNLIPYLSPADIGSLKKTCKAFKTTLDKLDVAWQPFLNQLHSIDETISVRPQMGQTIKEAFFAAFEKVKTRQLAEIAYYLRRRAWILADYPRLSAIKGNINQPLTLSDLTAISAELNALNSDMMTRRNYFFLYKSLLRDLSVGGITRFSKELIENPEHETFWRNLRRLDIADNLLQSLPSNIHKLKGLATLELSGNQLTTLPESIADIQSLASLSCAQNQLKALPNSFCKLQNLEGLSLANNQFTALPNSICKLKNLICLYLEGNQLTTLPSSIVELQALTKLYCGFNQLKALPDCIGKLQNLTVLFLSSNHLTALPETIGELNKLKYLYCDNNQLNALPDSIGKLKALKGLSCSHNHLTALPETIGELSKLMFLDCADNHLAALPDSICELRPLDYLDCHNNQLTALPKKISELKKLYSLNCADNQITALPPSLTTRFGQQWATETLARQRRPVEQAPIVEDVAPTLLVKRKLESDRNAKRRRISPHEIDSLRLDERWLLSAEKRNSVAKQSLTKRRK